MTVPKATFEIRYAFQVTGRQFFIVGEILSGLVKIGMTVNLASVGIDKRLKIEAVEFSLHRDNDKAWEYIGLGLSDLTEEEKILLKSKSFFSTPIEIHEENAS